MQPLTIGSLVLGVDDMARAAAFWQAALGYVPRDPGDDTWMVLIPHEGDGPQLALMRSEVPAAANPRVHLDLYAADQHGEVERLRGLGADVVEDWPGYSEDCDFVVMRDPEDNVFCVIDTGHTPG